MSFMKSIAFFTFSCFYLSLEAQSDTSKLLPSAEVVAGRFNAFSIGQTHNASDSQTLSLYNGMSLAEYLQAETPLSIKTYGTGLASMTMRGLAANQTAIIWNGINLQNPLNGGSDLAILDVGSVQKIDMKLGGCSALFGSGAMGGMVQLNNEKPQQLGIHGQFSYGYGSTNWQNSHAQLGFNTPKISSSVRVAYQSADNDFLFKNTAVIGQPLQNATHAAYHYLNINANLFYEISKNDLLKVNFWRSQNYREITPTMTANNSEAIYRDTANRLVGEWTHFFKTSFFKFRTAYVYDKNFYQSIVVKNSQNGISTNVNEAEWNYNFTDKHLLRLGFNATFDQSDNNNYENRYQRTRLALFINDVLKTRFIDLTGSVRQEWVAGTTTPTTFSMGFEKNINPQALKTAWILRGAFSRNFSLPSFNDLYWATLGNPNLVNEQGWSKELGISVKQKTDGQTLQAHLTLFDIDIQNRIAWFPQSDGQWRPSNINKVQSKGVETWISYGKMQQDFQYKITLNYQYAHATDDKGGAQLYAPAHKGGMSAWVKYKTLYAAGQQTASSRRFTTTDRTAWAKPYTLADVTLGFTPSFFKLKLDVRLNISNVFGADYQVITYYPSPKRQYRLEASILF
jgi:vitamin B12 transporter